MHAEVYIRISDCAREQNGKSILEFLPAQDRMQFVSYLGSSVRYGVRDLMAEEFKVCPNSSVEAHYSPRISLIKAVAQDKELMMQVVKTQYKQLCIPLIDDLTRDHVLHDAKNAITLDIPKTASRRHTIDQIYTTASRPRHWAADSPCPSHFSLHPAQPAPHHPRPPSPPYLCPHP